VRCTPFTLTGRIELANNLKPFDLNDNKGVVIEKSPLELRVEVLERKVELLLSARMREVGRLRK
jgi:hypothetical protein